MGANIFAQYLKPPKSVAEYGAEMDQADLRRLQLEGQQGQNQLLQVTRQQQMQAAQQQMTERNTLQRLAQQHGGDEEAFERALMSSGMPGLMSQAEGISKRRLDRKKTDSEIKERDAKTEKEKHDLAESKRKEAVQHIGAFSSPQEAMASLEKAADIPPEQKQAILQSLQATGGDPLKFREWQLRLVLSLANPEQQAKGMAPNVQTRNTGATTDTLAVDPLTGVGRVTGSVQNTQSPDSVASNARMSADAAANRAVTMRGQDIGAATAQRGQDLNAENKTNKPLAPAVVKQVTEARDNSATLDRLSTSFQDEYAGKGAFGLGADMQLAASGNLGVDKDSVDWWKNYRKQAELIERHALFGAALTPTEQASWRSADIGPGMDAAVVRRNLETRAVLAKKVFENTQQDMIDAGHNPERITALSSRNTSVQAPTVPKKADAYSDAEKEARYQAWKAKQK
jgi:hypothetical protein